MMHALTTSVSSKSTSMECSVLGRRVECKNQRAYKEKGLRYENLSSTLKKLCMWEKKLYDEVKVIIITGFVYFIFITNKLTNYL